jgi:hypothetical protein
MSFFASPDTANAVGRASKGKTIKNFLVMKTKHLFFLLLLTPFFLPAQTLDILQGSTGHSLISEIKKGPNGDLFATGYIYISMDYEGQTYPSSGLDDVFLARLDDAGQVQWMVTSGSPTGDDRALDMVLDKTNQRIYICGTVHDGAVFSTATNPYPFESSFLAAYDYNGNEQWVRWIGEAGGEGAHDLSLDPDGNIYVTGVFEDTAIFGSTTLTTVQGASFITSLDAAGNYRWAEKMESSLFVADLEVEATAVDELVLAGRYQGTISFAGGTFANLTSDQNIFALHFDASPGSVNWFTPVSSNESTVLTSLGLDNAGRPMLLGYNNFEATTTIDGQTFNDLVTFLIRLDDGIGQLYDVRPIGDGYFTARGMTVDAAGQTLITGSYTFQMEINGIALPTLNSNELLILRMQDNGTIDWYTVGEGPLNDIGTSLVVTDAGGLWVGGYYGVSLEIEGQTITAPGNNNVNLFLAHFIEAGVISSTVVLSSDPGIETNIFPNPVGDVLNVQLHTANSQTVDWRLYDVRGILYRQGQSTTSFTIQVDNLTSGTYFLECVVGGERKVVQVLKQ